MNCLLVNAGSVLSGLALVRKDRGPDSWGLNVDRWGRRHIEEAREEVGSHRYMYIRANDDGQMLGSNGYGVANLETTCHCKQPTPHSKSIRRPIDSTILVSYNLLSLLSLHLPLPVSGQGTKIWLGGPTRQHILRDQVSKSYLSVFRTYPGVINVVLWHNNTFVIFDATP